jgi:hypothetical protein
VSSFGQQPPPIPRPLIDRPTVAGLVVPIVTPNSEGRWLFGLLDHAQQQRCLRDRLCQICGRPLGEPLVLLLRESDLDARCTSEPGLHPECAAYTQRVCPMIAGRLAHYRATQREVPPGYRRATPDPVPELDALTSWLDEMAALLGSPRPTSSPRLGADAEQWHAVWLRAYDVETDPRNQQPAASYREYRPLRIRPVRRADTVTGTDS